jgi:hypothetical protein
LHCSANVLGALALKKIWSPGLYVAAKKVISTCSTWAQYSTRTHYPQMADLPLTRTTKSLPFQHVSIDQAGPFKIRTRDREGQKVDNLYILLRISHSTLAGHLEWSSDLTILTIHASLERFYARRNTPESKTSDRGAGFAHKKNLYNNIETDKHILWHLIAINWPHTNGLAEANLKTIKRMIQKSTGRQILSLEEFVSMIIKAEDIGNLRLISLKAIYDNLKPVTPKKIYLQKYKEAHT